MTSQVHIQLSYWFRDEQKLISYNSSIVGGNSSPLKRVIVNLKKKDSVYNILWPCCAIVKYHLMSITYATESSACQLWLEYSTQLKTLVSVLMVLARL